MLPYADPSKRAAYNRRYQKKYYRDNAVAQKKRVRDRKRKIKQWYREYKATLVCEDCGIGEEGRGWRLEFHHKDPATKHKAVSEMAHGGYAIKTIKDEIEKCVVLCSNCHRYRHETDNL